MSADLLRRAASVLRVRAEATRGEGIGISHWKVADLTDLEREAGQVTAAGHAYPQEVTNDRAVLIAQCFEGGPPSLAQFIALVDPTVGLAVATWLEQTAAQIASYAEHFTDGVERFDDLTEVDEAAHKVARAILREAS